MDLQIEQSEYGPWRVTTTSGDVFSLNDRNGFLEVRVNDGGVLLKPEASNAISIQGRLARGADW